MTRTIEVSGELADLLATPEDQARALDLLLAASRFASSRLTVEEHERAQAEPLEDDRTDEERAAWGDVLRASIRASDEGRHSPPAEVFVRLRAKHGSDSAA